MWWGMWITWKALMRVEGKLRVTREISVPSQFYYVAKIT
jgi:TfoX/Sxy family transcriptional regulator of competence genes